MFADSLLRRVFFCSGSRKQGGLGLRSRPGETGHGPVQHPRHPAVLESGRTLPQTVQSAGRPAARLLPGTNARFYKEHVDE